VRPVKTAPPQNEFMSNAAKQVAELLSKADTAPDGTTKVALIEEAVRIADVNNDVDLGYRARKQLLSACLHAGQFQTLMAAFAWCKAQVDRDPQRFGEHDLLLEYKWAAGELVGYPEFTRAQILELEEDMKRRYLEAGASMCTIYDLRCGNAAEMGDQTVAVKAYEAWVRARRDSFDRSEMYDICFRINYQRFLRRDQQMVDLASPFLTGALSHEHYRSWIYSLLLVPLVRLGRPRDAVSLHHKSYRFVSRIFARYINCILQHLFFLTLTDNLSPARRLLQRFFPMVFVNGNGDPSDHFRFFRASLYFLQRFEEQGRKQIKLILPNSCPVYDDADMYPVRIVSEWVRGELNNLAKRFDKRNGNNYFSRQIEELKYLDALVTPWPISSR
jgi:hypothetical protein